MAVPENQTPAWEEEQKKNEQQAQMPYTSGGGGARYSTPGTGKGTRSGSWTNLAQYQKANQPATQQMAGTIKSNIQKQGQQLQSDIASQSGEYSSDIGKKTTMAKERGDVYDALKNKGDYGKEIGEWRAAGGTDFNSPLQGGSAWDTAGLNQRVQDYQNRIAKAQTEQGKLAEVQRMQRPQATRGEGLLNQYLMQTSDAGRQALDSLKGTADPIAQNLEQQRAANQQALAQLTGAIDTTKGKSFDLQPEYDRIAEYRDTAGRGDFDAQMGTFACNDVATQYNQLANQYRMIEGNPNIPIAVKEQIRNELAQKEAKYNEIMDIRNQGITDAALDPYAAALQR